mmetsp:Transcript_12662/g.29803  ORF Transcript_12662/g.29803 Transcript_12662/m.29803 type:complete len:313 (-) Transcript_12662:483-1421(-)
MLSCLIATQRCRIYSTRSDVHGSPVAPPSLLCGQLPRFGRAHGRVEARGTDVEADKGAAPHVAPEGVRVVDRYALQVDLAAIGRGVARDRRDQRAAVREAEDALYQPLAERSAADDARAAVVVQRTSEHLARGGGSAVDPDLERCRPHHGALARVEWLLGAVGVGDAEHERLLGEEARDAHGPVEHAASVAAQVEHEARGALLLQLVDRLADAPLAPRVELAQLDVPHLLPSRVDQLGLHGVLLLERLGHHELARLGARRLGNGHLHQLALALDGLERVERRHALRVARVDVQHHVAEAYAHRGRRRARRRH